MSSFEEFTVDVPVKLVKLSTGLSIDIGNSAAKCVYRTKEDLEEAETEGRQQSRIHGVSFAKEDFEEGFKFVLERAHLTFGEEKVVNVTGLGGSVFGKLLMEKLQARLEVRSEFDCFAKAFFKFATHVSRRNLLHKLDDKVVTEAIQFALLHNKGCAIALPGVDEEGVTLTQKIDSVIADDASYSWTGFCHQTDVDDCVEIPLSEAEPDTFPCLVINVGSAYFSVQINKSGSSECHFVDSNSGGGRLLLAVANYLTGSKSFAEFICLAEKGNANNVNQTIGDIADMGDQRVDNDSSVYTKENMALVSAMVVYALGKAVGANAADFKPEDLARAWLDFVLQDIVRSVHGSCHTHRIRRVFFAGGVTTNPLVRQILAKEMVDRNLANKSIGKIEPIRFDFIKPSQHLGAFGCMVYDLLDSAEKDAKK